MKVLVIAPHPDDEVLGCGGTIAKHSNNGDQVFLCVCTKAYFPDWSEEFISNRPNEIAQVNEILGIRKTFFLNHPTVKLDTLPQKQLNDSLQKVVNKVKPDVIYSPHRGDLNKDHRLIFEAILVVTRPIKNQIKKILAYEVLSETEWGQSIYPFLPNYFVDISNTIDKKLQAMKIYGTEIKKHPHPRSLKNIKNHAIKRGSEVGLQFAEAFMLIKEIN